MIRASPLGLAPACNECHINGRFLHEGAGEGDADDPIHGHQGLTVSKNRWSSLSASACVMPMARPRA